MSMPRGPASEYAFPSKASVCLFASASDWLFVSKPSGWAFAPVSE